MKILIVVDMQKDFISGPLGTAEARAIVPYVAEKAKNTPRENLFVTLDTHQPNYMETNEGRHLPVPHCIEGTEGHALDLSLIHILTVWPAGRGIPHFSRITSNFSRSSAASIDHAGVPRIGTPSFSRCAARLMAV